jgi:hypothetical protein
MAQRSIYKLRALIHNHTLLSNITVFTVISSLPGFSKMRGKWRHMENSNNLPSLKPCFGSENTRKTEICYILERVISSVSIWEPSQKVTDS